MKSGPTITLALSETTDDGWRDSFESALQVVLGGGPIQDIFILTEDGTALEGDVTSIVPEPHDSGRGDPVIRMVLPWGVALVNIDAVREVRI